MAVLAVVSISASSLTAAASPVAQQEPDSESGMRPNVVLIYADDVDCESLFGQWPAQLPEQIPFPAIRELAMSGVTFTNFHVTTPSCAPSRACLLTGQYAHRNQVRVNQPGTPAANGFSGGYTAMNQDDEVGIWMSDAGYHTSFVGKYMHDGFQPDPEKRQSWMDIKPTGWNNFVAFLGGQYLNYSLFDADRNSFQTSAKTYRTDTEMDYAIGMIDGPLSKTEKPWLLCWAPYAAHMSTTPHEMEPDRYKDLYSEVVPSGFQTDAIAFPIKESDPDETRQMIPLSPESIELWTENHTKRLAALRALDDNLGRLIAKLKEKNLYENTIVIFTSDHGYTLGQHRHFGKRLPYARVTQVPFIAAGPGIPKNKTCDRLLANIDITPTLIDLANSEPRENVDGISFADSLYDPSIEKSTERDAILLENWDRFIFQAVDIECVYSAMRTKDQLYVEWASGAKQFFEINNDPEQINDRFASLSEDRKNELADQLRQLYKSDTAQILLGQEINFPKDYSYSNIFSANFKPIELYGFAEAQNGLKSVELEFYSADFDRSWTGTRWKRGRHKVAANIQQTAGVTSRWSYRLDSSEFAFSGKPFAVKFPTTVNVIATDLQDRQVQWDEALNFDFKISDPETWIDEHRETDQGEYYLKGRVADNVAIDRVTILFHDIDNHQFWNLETQQWQTKRVAFELPHSKIDSQRPGDWASWEITYTGDRPGRVYIGVRSYDKEHQFDASLAFVVLQPEDDEKSP